MKPVARSWTAAVWLVAAAWGWAGCGDRPAAEKAGAPETAGKPATRGGAGAGNPLTAPVDYLGAVGAAQKQAAKVADLAPLQQAVRAFQAGEDRLPETLSELVSEGYMPRLPAMPKGMVLQYNRQTGEVRIVQEAAPR